MGFLGSRSGLEKILIVALGIVSIVALAFIIAFATKKPGPPAPPNGDPYFLNMPYDSNRASKIRTAIFGQLTPGPKLNNGDLTGSSKNIREHMRVLTKDVHVAGSAAQLKAMDYVKQTYESYGLDKVEFTEYSVLLNYPNVSQPNTVSILNTQTNQFDIVSKGVGTPVGPADAYLQQNRSASAHIWWNAFAKGATVNASIVYANHGNLTDYQYLDSHNVSLQGKIVLVRYGKLWRGAKVYEAEKRGAVGVILFSDPADYGPPNGTSPFPNSVYLPPTGAQRGTLAMGDGDMTSPYYPSKPYVHRQFTADDLRSQLLYPSVPVTPIGYGDAQAILTSMDGPAAPPSFQGGLNVPGHYKIEGSSTYKLQVNNYDEPNAKIKNVIGYIVGSEEPDKWVILSNHVDAWTYGSEDPISGTAVLLEISRAMMAAVNQTGWRPRRTIVFCSWDAEEYGLFGSNEWSEEYLKVLESRAVALVNVDIGVYGVDTINADAVPLLYRSLVEAAKQVQNPNAAEMALGRKTVYDSWRHYYNDTNLLHDPTVPFMDVPGSGSDHSRFLNFIGIPVIDMSYTNVPYNYELYHSMYEVPWLIENLVDANFTTHVAMAQLWAEVIRTIADSVVIPFGIEDYGTKMANQYIPSLLTFMRTEGMNQTNLIPDFNQKATMLTDAGSRFKVAAQKLQAFANGINNGSKPASLRQVHMLNDRLINIEKCFINPRGLPKRGNSRHVVFASSVHDAYAGVLFAGIGDSIEDYKSAVRLGNSTAAQQWMQIIRLALTDVNFSIESAILQLDLNAFF